LRSLPSAHDPDNRKIYGDKHNEDAAILRAPPEGTALVQTIDVLAPISRSPYLFGRIAAANALSDIYAMGGESWSAMNIVSFPTLTEPIAMLSEILAGGLDMLAEAHCVLAGGHTLEEPAIKYGLAVTGYIDPKDITRNEAIQNGDILILTKPLGSGILGTAINGDFGDVDTYEATLARWATRLNRNAAVVMRAMKIKAATDITGFGLGGHAMEMAQASQCTLQMQIENLPFMENALSLAEQGFIPASSYANRKYCLSKSKYSADLSSLHLTLLFDAQTSGGILMAVPEAQVKETVQRLKDLGDEAWLIGLAMPYAGDNMYLSLV